MFPNPYLPIDLNHLKDLKKQVQDCHWALEKIEGELEELIEREKENRYQLREEMRKFEMGFSYVPTPRPQGACGC